MNCWTCCKQVRSLAHRDHYCRLSDEAVMDEHKVIAELEKLPTGTGKILRLARSDHAHVDALAVVKYVLSAQCRCD